MFVKKSLVSLFMLMVLFMGGCGLNTNFPQKAADTWTFKFADKADGQLILGRDDLFLQSLSPFDRAVRMQSRVPVSQKTFISFIQSQVMSWQPLQRDRLERIINRVKKSLVPYQYWIPRQINLVLTTGKEEGDAPYTRGDSIVIPQSLLLKKTNQIQQVFFHELFHIISRSHPSLRERLYDLIGFQSCGLVRLPASYSLDRITNPDAPVTRYCINVKDGDGQLVAVAPILLAQSKVWSEGALFNNYRFVLMQVHSNPARPVLQNGSPIFYQPSQLKDFYSQIGNNTRYIIHPDEILADNFSYLMMQRKDLPTPGLLQKMKAVLLETT